MPMEGAARSFAQAAEGETNRPPGCCLLVVCFAALFGRGEARGMVQAGLLCVLIDGWDVFFHWLVVS